MRTTVLIGGRDAIALRSGIKIRILKFAGRSSRLARSMRKNDGGGRAAPPPAAGGADGRFRLARRAHVRGGGAGRKGCGRAVICGLENSLIELGTDSGFWLI
ncbi:hypothetical protein EVAR_85484_1 [Eumeta japonica]|uniref:Uncharacterized protein n=1 Tax=Eumeta variegata TaxID=151549 RepID=A0A4C1VD89_EUMVA|nr:hypothetical protein EVAR_85484_1 [Eumeta japonica]